MRKDGAKRCKQKKKTVRRWGRGESEGKPIPYDWSILTALVSTRRFLTLIGNVIS